MTREEAITVLKDISWQMGSVKRWENIEAIDIAIEALSADAEPKWKCTANFVAEQLSKLEDMTVSERIKLIQDILGVEFKEENLTRPSAKLKKHCNSLLTEESNGSKEHKSELDLISRADAIKAVAEHFSFDDGCSNIYKDIEYYKGIAEHILKNVPSALPSAEAVHGEWTPCGEKLPKELERVNITWLNHNPPFYYQHIKDIPQTDTAVYYRGKWYWWDATVMDLLGEYDGAYVHGIEPIDQYIEITAWMPLPTPYKGGAE